MGGGQISKTEKFWTESFVFPFLEVIGKVE